MPVAGGQIGAPHRDLARLPRRHRGSGRIDDQRLHVLDGLADGDHAVGHGTGRGEEELADQPALGGAEPVDEDAIGGEVLAEEREIAWRGAVALEANQTQGGERAAMRRDRAKEGGNGVIHGHRLLGEPSREPLGAVARHVEGQRRGAVEEGAEQAGYGTAEGRPLEQGEAVVRGEPQGVGVAHHVVQDIAVRVEHALGAPRRARGVEDVGARVGRDLEAGRLVTRRRGQRGHVQRGGVGRHRARAPGVARIGDDEPRSRVGDRLAEAKRRVRGIEGHVDLAGLERAQHRHHLIDALGEEQGHRLVAVADPVDDGVRDAVGGVLQRAIAEALRAHLHRQPPGLLGGVALESGGERAFEIRPRELDEWVRGSPVGPRTGSWLCSHR